MNEKEIRQTVNAVREEYKKHFPNKTQEERDQLLLDSFFKAYCEDQMDREDLTVLASVMGYEVDKKILDKIEKEKKRGKK